MSIKLYNTLGRQVVPFIPHKEGKVSLYACGPTVYNYAHIGNLRTYINEDTLRRALEWNGLSVTHVMNITDVGHLVSDEDSGDDKMELSAQKQNRSIWEIAETYTKAFQQDVAALNILSPHIWCKATDHIKEQIALVQKLEALGLTYINDDGVYYDTSRFKDYGLLGGQNLDELLGGARIQLSDGKKHITDFALWKFSPKDSQRLMEWDSPWGKGFPGWHIECSAMAMRYLGEKLDIHCGGVDHVKIHHTNEMAQVEPVIGHQWVNYWFHSEFLIEKDGKMSKSKGEFLTLSLLQEKGFHPLAYRYYALGCHYRSKMTFSYENMMASQQAYQKLTSRMLALKAEKEGLRVDEQYYLGAKAELASMINNDLNTAQVLAYLWTLLKDSSVGPATQWAIIQDIDALLGLGLCHVVENKEETIPAEITELVDQRVAAKKEKNFALADVLRQKISDLGFIVEDSPQGPKIKKK